jgi:hypothetical protein
MWFWQIVGWNHQEKMPERTKNLLCPVVGGLGMYSMVVQNIEKQTEKMCLYGGYVVARQTET